MSQSENASSANQTPLPAAPKRKKSRAWFWGLLVGLLLVVVIAALVIAPRYIKGTADGTLVGASSNAPITNAEIRTSTRAVKTDSSGHFELRHLPLGDVPVTVAVPGFSPFSATLHVKALSVTDTKLVLPDASLTVALREAASQPATVSAPTVLIDGASVLPDASGEYVARGIPPKNTTIRVSGEDYETTETAVALNPGRHSVVVVLSLTPKATLARYYHAFDQKDWKAAYTYLHPDVTKRESFATFEKDMKAWGTSTSLVVSNVTMLPRWVSPTTGKIYPNVAAITRTLAGKGPGGSYTNKATQHWTRVNGIWLRVDV
jgi:Carboxypeptidase regulatory-like domain